jgi:hypothetical protein
MEYGTTASRFAIICVQIGCVGDRYKRILLLFHAAGCNTSQLQRRASTETHPYSLSFSIFNE